MFEAIFILAPLDIQTLQQAQSSDKKHKKLEEEVKNHSVVVDKVVDSGVRLTEAWAELKYI